MSPAAFWVRQLLLSFLGFADRNGATSRLDFAAQADEADEEDVGMEDSANDGFFVSDGQLSDDEGLSSVQQDIDELCAEQEGKPLDARRPSDSWISARVHCR